MEIKAAVQVLVSELYHRYGDVKPSALLEAAKPKESPAHAAFEWDNKKAGHEYRLIQARTWIRRVSIIVEDVPERLIHVPRIAVADDTEGNEGYYKPVSVMDRDEYKLALSATLTTLNTAKSAYSELKLAAKAKTDKVPDFIMADRGFEMVETALISG